ncbi:hypothetical protein ACD631_17840 [Alteromonas macleodii]|uniref:hypothetical protein n=1 Tax=Alteromonas macleodii TaxID=28108 RepID=UPI002076808C|nr:hypothetical protein [Alteromonas macleodii]USI28204.1 hypothetical protein NFG60_00525 [Alteromonas macleodii]
MKLILHIGTHKTGTTTIQRAFASNRSSLLEIGVWYPNYHEVLGGGKTNYAHLDIAKALMDEKSALSKGEAIQFLQQLYASAVKLNNVNTVVISAETLLRGKLGSDKKKWAKIQNFQKKLKEHLIGFTDIEVTVTFRNHSSYLESLYNEHIKATTYSKSIQDFYEDYKERFNYRGIVSSWNTNVGPVQVINFSDIAGENIVEKWAEQVINKNFSGIFNKVNSEQNVSWPLELVELKRIINLKNDKALAKKFRTIITEFSKTELCASIFEKKQTWLSGEYRKKIIATYKTDIEWLCDNYSKSCLSLLNVPVTESEVFSGLKDKHLATLIKYLINPESELAMNAKVKE